MKSMTGYGRGEASHGGLKVTVELSSVNRRQTEISVYLPRELESLEPRLRDIINHGIARGRLVVKVALHGMQKTTNPVSIDTDLAKRYARQLRQLAKELKLDGEVTLQQVLAIPGIVKAETVLPEAEDLWPMLERALRQALKALVAMREREGTHLLRDLRLRMKAMRQAALQIKKQAPRVVKRFQEQLRERVRSAGLEMPGTDDERLLREVVYYADRSDISEELTRLESHFNQFEQCTRSREPVGRMLDFLAQEINREINTVGSKSADSLISQQVVKLKAELEKFREQVQNVE